MGSVVCFLVNYVPLVVRSRMRMLKILEVKEQQDKRSMLYLGAAFPLSVGMVCWFFSRRGDKEGGCRMGGMRMCCGCGCCLHGNRKMVTVQEEEDGK